MPESDGSQRASASISVCGVAAAPWMNTRLPFYTLPLVTQPYSTEVQLLPQRGGVATEASVDLNATS